MFILIFYCIGNRWTLLNWYYHSTLHFTNCVIEAFALYIRRGFIADGRRVTARFVTRFNLWLRHDLWPQNASICDPARFVTKSASICDQRYTMILESKLSRGTLVFVFTLIMYATWYNMIHIYIYELCYNTYINSGARSLMLFYINTIWISCMTYTHHISYMCIIFYASFVI